MRRYDTEGPFPELYRCCSVPYSRTGSPRLYSYPEIQGDMNISSNQIP